MWDENKFQKELHNQHPNTIRYSTYGYIVSHKCIVCKKIIKARKKYCIVYKTDQKRYVVCSEKCGIFCLFQHLGDEYA